MNKLHGDDGHKFKITVKDGTVVSVTGPGLDNEPVGSSSGSTGYSWSAGGGGGEAGAARGAGGVTGAGGGEGGKVGWGGGGGQGRGEGWGVGRAGSSKGLRTGGAGEEGTGEVGAEGGDRGNEEAGAAGGTQGGRVGGREGAMGASGGTLGFGKGGNFQNKTGGGANSKSSMPPNAHRKVTYIPKQGEDSQTMARSLVWRAGGASKSKLVVLVFIFQELDKNEQVTS